MEATLASAQQFAVIVETLAQLTDSAALDVTPAGIALAAMDSAHIALAALELRAAGFERFECARPLRLGVHFGALQKAFGFARGDERLTLRYAEARPDVLRLRLESPDGGKVLDFALPLLHIEEEAQTIGSFAPEATARIDAAEFARVVRDLGVVGDVCSLSISTTTGVRFVCATSEVGRVEVALAPSKAEPDEGKGEGEGENQNKGEDQGGGGGPPKRQRQKQSKKTTGPRCAVKPGSADRSATCMLRFFIKFAKAAPLCDFVQLQLADGLPVKLNFPFFFGALAFYLAPRLDEGEGEGDGLPS